MKYILLYIIIFILLIPPVIMGGISFLWNPCKRGFRNGSSWLDVKFNYGNLIDNLINKL